MNILFDMCVVGYKKYQRIFLLCLAYGEYKVYPTSKRKHQHFQWAVFQTASGICERVRLNKVNLTFSVKLFGKVSVTKHKRKKMLVIFKYTIYSGEDWQFHVKHTYNMV